MTTQVIAEQLRATGCAVCAHTAEHGWHGLKRGTHCSGCHRTWTGSREAHCTVCHRHFGGPTGFDHHLFGPPDRPAGHRDPVAPGKNPRPYSQDGDGVWRQAWHVGNAISGESG